MRIEYSPEFAKAFRKLPLPVASLFGQIEPFLRTSPFHPRIRGKRLHGAWAGYFSFRVTRRYRVIFSVPEPDVVRLHTIEHRKDVYR